jgi:hypothetical protein
MFISIPGYLTGYLPESGDQGCPIFLNLHKIWYSYERSGFSRFYRNL